MATKFSNAHLEEIITKSKSYYVIDVYIALTHISSEVKNRFLIQTYTSNKADLANQVKKYVNASYKTIVNNLDELIRLNILTYSEELSSWTLCDMENMTLSKKDPANAEKLEKLQGYTKIRKFFLTNEFNKMKAIEKRCLVFLAHLRDSRASKSYESFIMNLVKPNSVWQKILKTDNKYYAKYIIEEMLEKYKELFVNTSEELRAKDLAPKKISNFKFSFSCKMLEKVENDNSQYELIKMCNPNELQLVTDKCKFANVTLSNIAKMHIVRAMATIKHWAVKERVAQIIVNKYTSIQVHGNKNTIKSLPAYMLVVVKSAIDEFNEFMEHKKRLSKEKNEFEFLDICTDNSYLEKNYDNLKKLFNL